MRKNRGVMVWGKDYDAWNPVSFYEHMDYVRADQSGLDVLVWKAFNKYAKAPKLLVPLKQPVDSSRAQVTNITNGWCGGGCHLCMMVRDAVEDIPEEVELTQIYAHEKTDMLAQGESFDVVYIDGISFRPDGPPANKEELKQAILQRHSQKNLPRQ